MVLYPNAKINLGLNIINKRSDGFHNLETLFLPVPLCDILEVVRCDEPFGGRSESHSAGGSYGLVAGMGCGDDVAGKGCGDESGKNFGDAVGTRGVGDGAQIFLYGNKVEGDPADNLCMRAYRLMKDRFGIEPVEIHLYKKIPTGAGLGGGSSDAAFTLIALNQLFQLGLSDDDLAGFAAMLGSDCPFFIYNTPMMARGRGEILSRHNISLEGYHIELVHPEVFVSTKEAYAGVTPHEPEVWLQDALSHPIEEWRGLIVNDFEESIFKKYPALARAKQALYDHGAVYASMSGSGSSLYGIFRD